MTRFSLVTLLLSGLFYLFGCSGSPTKPDLSRYYIGPEGDQVSIFRRHWHPASAPKHLGEYSDFLNWYNPHNQYPTHVIRPDIDPLNLTTATTNILNLVFQTKDGTEYVSGGIMQYMGNNTDIDLTKSEYLDIMLLGQNGTLEIDIGVMSEDVIPNRELDSEDKLRDGVRNGELDDGEDIGLDGMANEDPRAVAAGGDFWDINGNGEKEPGEPFSHDDWNYDRYDSDEDYTRINGSEGNAGDKAGVALNTEDLNGNDKLDIEDNYWTFELQLESDHPDNEQYVFKKSINDKGRDFGWRWYRIPLTEFKTIGSPSTDKVECIRLWAKGKNYNDKGMQVLIAFITFTTKESEG